jgi:hypothetical protein
VLTTSATNATTIQRMFTHHKSGSKLLFLVFPPVRRSPDRVFGVPSGGTAVGVPSSETTVRGHPKGNA